MLKTHLQVQNDVVQPSGSDLLCSEELYLGFKSGCEKFLLTALYMQSSRLRSFLHYVRCRFDKKHATMRDLDRNTSRAITCSKHGSHSVVTSGFGTFSYVKLCSTIYG